MYLEIYTDGACKGNPGPAAIGAVLFDNKHTSVLEISKAIGYSTNNKAEYRAIIEALNAANKLKADEVALFMDSELVARQLTGKYRVKNKDLFPLYIEVKNLLSKFSRWSVNHIKRELNSQADSLANNALQ